MGITMSQDNILIAGAREHNLRNITVKIPRGKLTVVTGLSGSGKSSLAFDTLYAEGQRRYVESLSAYARQFLNQMQKPDVDYIDGLSPAIAIEQRTAGANPRSIVATSTEVHDYLRLLYSNIGEAHCPKCARPVKRQSAQEIVERLLALPNHTKVVVIAPLARGMKGRHQDALEQARKMGFIRVRVDGEIHEMDGVPELDPKKAHTIEVVIDRLVITDRIRPRLTDSVETGLKCGKGVIAVMCQIEGQGLDEKLFSEKHCCPDCGISFEELAPRSFSFNSPYGACQVCSGLGSRLVFDEDLVVPNRDISIDAGAIHAWRRGGRRLIIYYKQLLRSVAKHYGFSLETPFDKLSAKEQKILLHGSGDEEMTFGYWRGGAYREHKRPFEGIIPNLERRYGTTESEYTRQRLRHYMSRQRCPACEGGRLKPEAIACTVGGRSIVDVAAMSVKDAVDFFRGLDISEHQKKIVGEVLKEIERRLKFLVDVGLEYLTLDRESGTLSGGEAQRIRLATQIGSGLTGVLYVLDEPTIGLHVRDNRRLIAILKELRDLGNTIVVVEHDEQMIREADHIIDLGPGAGRHGGRVVAEGTVAELLGSAESLTARFLNKASGIRVPATRARPDGAALRILGARENNLKDIDVVIPLGLFVCVTGVSGSGKSTLVDDTLRRTLFRRFYGAKETPGKCRRIIGIDLLDKVVVIDQSPIGRTPRSNPATYTGAFSFIRQIFAEIPSSKVRGYGPGRYSFNVKGGRCETCKGDGILCLEMHFLPDVYVTCEQCGGARYNRETLDVLFHGKNIADILAMTVDEALDFLHNVPAVERKLKTLSDVGLGYLQLGQSATTLSGGEAQRIKLASELSKKSTGKTMYLLDEPTTGLHFADTQRLLHILLRLREAGNTVVVVEHNMEVIKTADHIIDLGPGGGDAGGEVVVAGSPEEVALCEKSYTGAFLKKALAAGLSCLFLLSACAAVGEIPARDGAGVSNSSGVASNTDVSMRDGTGDAMKLGKAALEDGLCELAQKQFENHLRSVAISPEEYGMTLALLARALYEQKKFAEAVDLLNANIGRANVPSQVGALVFWRALSRHKIGKHDEAIKELDEFSNQIALSDCAGPSERLRAWCRLDMGQTNEALAAFAQFDKTHGDSIDAPDNLLDWGRLLLSLNRDEEARDVLARLVKMPGGAASREGRYWLGHALIKEGKWPEAGAILEALTDDASAAGDLRCNAFFALATVHEAQTNATKAAEALERGISAARDPELEKAGSRELGRVLLDMGRIEEGMSLVKTFISSSSDSPLAETAQLNLAGKLLGLGRNEEALNGFQHYLETFTNRIGQAQAYEGKGWALFNLARYAEAATAFGKAHEISSDSPRKEQCLFKAGDAYFANSQYKLASETYQRVLDEFPDSGLVASALFQLADSQARAGNRSASREGFARLAEKHPDASEAQEALLRIAEMDDADGELDKAIEGFERMIKTYPNSVFHPDALYGRGLAYYRLLRFEDALRDFERVTADFPTNAVAEEAFTKYAMCHYWMGNDKKAVELHEKFLQQHENSRLAPRAMFWIGNYEYNQGNFENAEKQFLLFLEKYQGDSRADGALLWASRAAFARKEYVRSIELLTRMVKEHPDSGKIAEARFAQAEALCELAKFSEAIVILDEIVNKHPNSDLIPAAWVKRGDSQFMLGGEDHTRYEEAMKSYRMAVNSLKASLDLILEGEYKTGRCLDKLGRDTDAVDQYYSKVMIRFLEERAKGVWHNENSKRWFALASSKAADIMEARKEWRQAVRILERVVASGVPQVEDTQERIKRIKAESWWLF